MSEAEQHLSVDRANRQIARQLVESGVRQVKADLAARGIGGRIKDSAVREAKETLATGIEVARENKPVIAGTIALLLVWFLRNPLGRMLGRMFGRQSEDVQGPDASAGSDKE